MKSWLLVSRGFFLESGGKLFLRLFVRVLGLVLAARVRYMEVRRAQTLPAGGVTGEQEQPGLRRAQTAM